VDVVFRRLELLKLRESQSFSDDDLRALAQKFVSRVESSQLDREWEKTHQGEPLTMNSMASMFSEDPRDSQI